MNSPFSKKMFELAHTQLREKYGSDGKVQFLVQNVIQPWHPTSCLLHEASLAVAMLDSSKFYG